MTTARPDFGPNGQAVDEFLAQIDRLTDAQVMELAGWAHPDPDAEHALEAVRRSAADRVQQAGRSEALGWARDVLADRVTRMAQSPFDSDLVWASGAVHAFAAGRREAFPVLLDALVALIGRDVLDPAEFDILYGPWQDAEQGEGPGPTPDEPDRDA